MAGEKARTLDQLSPGGLKAISAFVLMFNFFSVFNTLIKDSLLPLIVYTFY